MECGKTHVQLKETNDRIYNVDAEVVHLSSVEKFGGGCVWETLAEVVRWIRG